MTYICASPRVTPLPCASEVGLLPSVHLKLAFREHQTTPKSLTPCRHEDEHGDHVKTENVNKIRSRRRFEIKKVLGPAPDTPVTCDIEMIQDSLHRARTRPRPPAFILAIG